MLRREGEKALRIVDATPPAGRAAQRGGQAVQQWVGHTLLSTRTGDPVISNR
jgi:hypothetical protein